MDMWKMLISKMNTMGDVVLLKTTEEKVGELKDRKSPE